MFFFFVVFNLENKMSLKIKIFRDDIEIPIPKKSYEDSAAFDLTCPTTVTLIPRLCESIDIRIRNLTITLYDFVILKQIQK